MPSHLAHIQVCPQEQTILEDPCRVIFSVHELSPTLSGTGPCPSWVHCRACSYIFMWIWRPGESQQLVPSCRMEHEPLAHIGSAPWPCQRAKSACPAT